jgi:hypothetical protein
MTCSSFEASAVAFLRPAAEHSALEGPLGFVAAFVLILMLVSIPVAVMLRRDSALETKLHGG